MNSGMFWASGFLPDIPGRGGAGRQPSPRPLGLDGRQQNPSGPRGGPAGAADAPGRRPLRPRRLRRCRGRRCGVHAASAEAKRHAARRLAEIDARGSTDLAGGWLEGCEQVAPHLAEEPHGRCLLLTDGLANVGETDPNQLVARAASLRARHIVTSTFGVGADFDEDLLQRLAEQSGGRFYFIERAGQIPDLLTSELGEALQVVARGATLAVQLPSGARAEPLTRFEWCATDSGMRIALGDLVSRQELEVGIGLTAGPSGGRSDRLRVALGDRDGVLASSPQDVSWTAAAEAQVAASPRDRVVDRAVAEFTRRRQGRRRSAQSGRRVPPCPGPAHARRGPHCRQRRRRL